MEKEKYPQCMQNIIEEIENGGDPSHRARFALVSFLLRVGVSKQEIKEDLFPGVGDYDKRTTDYQVDNIAEEGYYPPKCKGMIQDGLCPFADQDVQDWDDSLCKQDWMDSPLYYFNVKDD